VRSWSRPYPLRGAWNQPWRSVNMEARCTRAGRTPVMPFFTGLPPLVSGLLVLWVTGLRTWWLALACLATGPTVLAVFEALRHVTRKHYVPAPDCRCGIYAYWSPGLGQVAGVVKGWGKGTMSGTLGFRAHYAEIVALAVPLGEFYPATIRKLRDAYHVPVYDDVEEMLAHHPLSTPPVIP
jgi:hypothetical protein